MASFKVSRKLRPKKKKVSQESREAEIQRELIEAERRMTQAWVEQNVEFSQDHFIDAWMNNRDKYKQVFAALVTKYLSFAEGAQEANKLLKYGLKLDNAGIDIQLLQGVIIKALNVDVAAIIAEQLGVSDEQKASFVSRVIARELPSRDNQSKFGGLPVAQLTPPG